MTKKNPIYGQGFHHFSDEKNFSNDPWHERYRYGSHYRRGPKISEVQSSRIWEDVCDVLANAFDVDASQMEVYVEDNIVFLSGNARSPEEALRAEKLAYSVFGVEKVRNQLHVMYDQKSFS